MKDVDIQLTIDDFGHFLSVDLGRIVIIATISKLKKYIRIPNPKTQVTNLI